VVDSVPSVTLYSWIWFRNDNFWWFWFHNDSRFCHIRHVRHFHRDDVVDAPQPQIGHHEIVELELVLPVFQFLFGRLGNLDIHRGFLLLNCSHDSLRILVQHHGIERFLLHTPENHARGIPNADGRREHVRTLSPFLAELFPDKHT